MAGGSPTSALSFNSRTPKGCDELLTPLFLGESEFQFTHP